MQRQSGFKEIENLFKVSPSIGLLGPRQCGKTTLSKQYLQYFKDQNPNIATHHYDLENPNDRILLENPYNLISPLEGLIIIDEIQLAPDLFSVMRVLIDDNKNRKFLFLGSASRDLIRQSSQSLAGRIAYLELTPFRFKEVQDLDLLLLRGGFPNSILADSDEHSFIWRENYIRTFLEIDIPNLGIKIPTHNLRRFWMMLAHYHGNIFNASEIGNSLNLNSKTIKSYLNILTGTFMVRQLNPWYENISKRQVKSPKIYFRDSGIINNLLGVNSRENLLHNPKLGALWESFALEEVISHLNVRNEDCYFWATQNKAELDLLVFKNGQRLGFEFRWSDVIKTTKSMHIAIEDLNLDYLTIIYPGEKTFQISDKIKAVGLRAFLESKI